MTYTVAAAAVTVAATPVETVAQIKTNTFPQDLERTRSREYYLFTRKVQKIKYPPNYLGEKVKTFLKKS